MEKRLLALLDMPQNGDCAECDREDNRPTWASFFICPVDQRRLAVLICPNCHHLHQTVGEGEFELKGLKDVSDFSESDLYILEISGNRIVNCAYEAMVRGDEKRGRPNRRNGYEAYFFEKMINLTYFNEDVYRVLISASVDSYQEEYNKKKEEVETDSETEEEPEEKKGHKEEEKKETEGDLRRSRRDRDRINRSLSPKRSGSNRNMMGRDVRRDEDKKDSAEDRKKSSSRRDRDRGDDHRRSSRQKEEDRIRELEELVRRSSKQMTFMGKDIDVRRDRNSSKLNLMLDRDDERRYKDDRYGDSDNRSRGSSSRYELKRSGSSKSRDLGTDDKGRDRGNKYGDSDRYELKRSGSSKSRDLGRYDKGRDWDDKNGDSDKRDLMKRSNSSKLSLMLESDHKGRDKKVDYDNRSISSKSRSSKPRDDKWRGRSCRDDMLGGSSHKSKSGRDLLGSPGYESSRRLRSSKSRDHDDDLQKSCGHRSSSRSRDQDDDRKRGRRLRDRYDDDDDSKDRHRSSSKNDLRSSNHRSHSSSRRHHSYDDDLKGSLHSSSSHRKRESRSPKRKDSQRSLDTRSSSNPDLLDSCSNQDLLGASSRQEDLQGKTSNSDLPEQKSSMGELPPKEALPNLGLPASTVRSTSPTPTRTTPLGLYTTSTNNLPPPTSSNQEPPQTSAGGSEDQAGIASSGDQHTTIIRIDSKNAIELKDDARRGRMREQRKNALKKNLGSLSPLSPRRATSPSRDLKNSLPRKPSRGDMKRSTSMGNSSQRARNASDADLDKRNATMDVKPKLPQQGLAKSRSSRGLMMRSKSMDDDRFSGLNLTPRRGGRRAMSRSSSDPKRDPRNIGGLPLDPESDEPNEADAPKEDGASDANEVHDSDTTASAEAPKTIDFGSTPPNHELLTHQKRIEVFVSRYPSLKPEVVKAMIETAPKHLHAELAAVIMKKFGLDDKIIPEAKPVSDDKSTPEAKSTLDKKSTPTSNKKTHKANAMENFMKVQKSSDDCQEDLAAVPKPAEEPKNDELAPSRASLGKTSSDRDLSVSGLSLSGTGSSTEIQDLSVDEDLNKQKEAAERKARRRGVGRSKSFDDSPLVRTSSRRGGLGVSRTSSRRGKGSSRDLSELAVKTVAQERPTLEKTSSDRDMNVRACQGNRRSCLSRTGSSMDIMAFTGDKDDLNNLMDEPKPRRRGVARSKSSSEDASFGRMGSKRGGLGSSLHASRRGGLGSSSHASRRGGLGSSSHESKRGGLGSSRISSRRLLGRTKSVDDTSPTPTSRRAGSKRDFLADRDAQGKTDIQDRTGSNGVKSLSPIYGRQERSSSGNLNVDDSELTQPLQRESSAGRKFSLVSRLKAHCAEMDKPEEEEEPATEGAEAAALEGAEVSALEGAKEPSTEVSEFFSTEGAEVPAAEEAEAQAAEEAEALSKEEEAEAQAKDEGKSDEQEASEEPAKAEVETPELEAPQQEEKRKKKGLFTKTKKFGSKMAASTTNFGFSASSKKKSKSTEEVKPEPIALAPINVSASTGKKKKAASGGGSNHSLATDESSSRSLGGSNNPAA